MIARPTIAVATVAAVASGLVGGASALGAPRGNIGTGCWTR